MNESLEKFRRELRETVLPFVWRQWSSIGVMGSGGGDRERVIDPEPLLLLTLEVARQDPRMFDEVVDWLIVNGKWVNVVRLSTLLEEDKTCAHEVMGAVAATLARHDKTPKWQALAKKLKPKKVSQPDSLFLKEGKSLFLPGMEADSTFGSYGLLRSPVNTRGMSSPVIPSPTPLWTASNFMFKARALFGVNIRADVFAFLVLQGAANPTRIARELGYSQRRVHDTLADMAGAGLFKVRTEGKAKLYLVNSESVLKILGVTDSGVAWFDWRALARALTAIWCRACDLREEGMTPYLLESEQAKALREVNNELLKAVPPGRTESQTQETGLAGSQGLIPTLQSVLPSSPGYRWKRFWAPRGLASPVNRGIPFATRHDLAWPSPVHSNAVDLESASRVPCLVLLGEPGMGKSFELKRFERGLEKSMNQTMAKILSLDLRSYGSEERLVRDLFESETVRSWSRGEHDLYVLLDSLDEALARPSVMANLLSDKLGQLPSVAGLFLRIACRTAEWPESLETGLKSRWAEHEIKVLELMPLNHADVAEAAAANAIDPEEFLRQVDCREVAPLTFKPVTLNFLLKSFQSKGQLASRQKELYEEGCRILCAETNAGRIGARLTGKLTAVQRMEVAAHMAAATVFCNRDAIWMGPAGGMTPGADLSLDELCAGAGGLQGEHTSKECVTEALGTGLFSSRGPDRLGWAHQTYAEFLAAWHLHRSGTNLRQKLGLLIHQGDPEKPLVPQLHETAAWLAGMDSGVFRELMKSNPEVLLRSDVATAAPKDREKLVASILGRIEESKNLKVDWLSKVQYGKLAHPRLPDQLRPFILGRSKNPRVRREAIDMAMGSKLKVLAADLALVALDSSEKVEVRVSAAGFVAEMGEPALRSRLKPLLNLTRAEDPSNELKGIALQACWPDLITAEEIFQTLTPPKNKGFLGTYRNFLSKSLVDEIKSSDLHIALGWVRQQVPKQDLGFSFGKQIEDILTKASKHLDDPNVLREFAKTVLDRLGKFDEMIRPGREGWRNVLISDESVRRRVIDALLPEMANPEKDAFYCTCCGVRLIAESDFLWLIERLEKETDSQRQTALAHLIRRVFEIGQASHVDAVMAASEKNPLLRTLFAYFLEPVSIASEEARKAREEHAEQKAFEAHAARSGKERPLHPPPAERIAGLLDRFEVQGDLDAWWRLTMEMTLEPTSTHYEDEENTDLTELPGWISADDVTRKRIIAAATKYVVERDANPDAWFWKESIYHRPAAAGFKALRLLHQEAPETFAQLAESTWVNWLPIVFQESRFDTPAHNVIVAAAYRSAPAETIQWLDRLIDRENQREGHLTILSQLNAAWDARLGEAILEKSGTPGLKPGVLLPLVDALLAHAIPGAKELAESLIRLPLPQDQPLREQVIGAAKALLERTTEGWSTIWPGMLQDPEFGRVLFECLAHDYDHDASRIARKLTESQVSDLHIWLAGQFPPEKDPCEEGAHLVTSREEVGLFRNGLVTYLTNLGTSEAWEAMQRLTRQFPSNLWLKGMLAQARSAMRAKTWRPPNPRELFTLLASDQGRLVRDGGELLDLVIESLERLESKLQGETAAVEFLWDKVPGTNHYRPKDESALANFIKLHLESDLNSRGVVVNREVEIRRGQETDIHVDAVTREGGGGFDHVTVIIEIKGSWHPELEGAIESQLVGRYLRDNACQHGLYLVGWFDSGVWDEQDYRKSASAKTSREEVEQRLSAKALEQSKAGLRIEAVVLNAGHRARLP